MENEHRPNIQEYPYRSYNLQPEEFARLYHEIIDRMARDHNLSIDEQGASHKFYGMGMYAPGTPDGAKLNTVASIFARNAAVQRLLHDLAASGEKGLDRTNFGDYLYKRYNEYTKNREKGIANLIILNGRKYVYGYFAYLGYSTPEAFFQEHTVAPEAIPADAPAGQSGGDGWTYYLGSYFSVKSFGVRNFVLAIRFDQPKDNRYPAREWGFHKLGDIVEEPTTMARGRKIELGGSASIVDRRWLCVELRGDETRSPFYLIAAYRENRLAERPAVMRGILLTISIREYPVTVEAVLIRTTAEYAHKAANMYEQLAPPELLPTLGYDASDMVKLYVMLQRRNFYVNPGLIEDITKLQARGTLVKNYTFLSGVYRILNFGLRRNYVIQSVMVVEAHQYRATLYPYIKEEVLQTNRDLAGQYIVFDISRIRQNKLCLTAYTSPGMSVSSHAIFDLETGPQLGYYEGCFISTGYDSRGIIGGYCVVQRIDDRDGHYLKLLECWKNDDADGARAYAETHRQEHLLELQPREFTEEEMQEYARKHKLESLYQGLREIWKKKLWKQRKKYTDDYPYQPQMIRCENVVYILRAPLDCQVSYVQSQIEIACSQLGIIVRQADRALAEHAFSRAFHQLNHETAPAHLQHVVRGLIEKTVRL